VRLKKQHRQRGTLARDHMKWIEKRSKRLEVLAREFAICKERLCAQDKTTERMEVLWEASDLFKEEILEVAECVNEYFRTARKRRRAHEKTTSDLKRLQGAVAELGTKPEGRKKPTRGNGILLTNPFLLHPEDYVSTPPT